MQRINKKMLHFTEEWSENFPYQLLIAAGVALIALVLLAAVSFQCSSTWRWLMNMTRHENIEDTETDQTQQNAIRISHSLPDLQSEPITHEYVQEQKENKKVLSNLSISCVSNIPQFVPILSHSCLNINVILQVLRQTTLPIVPMRHQSFQRQLSHRLDLPNIKFSICSFENRSDSSLGLIKVFSWFFAFFYYDNYRNAN